MSKTKKNNGTGAGGSRTNLNGLKWESNTYLGVALKNGGYDLVITPEIKKIKGSTVTPLFEIHKNSSRIGFYGQQGQVYKMLQLLFAEKMSNIYIDNVLSKKINPDGFIYNDNTKTLHIFEKKWQQTSGSVDEKLQTAPYKRQMFKKLLSNTDLEVTYQYVLSKWFKAKAYDNIREYYNSLVNEKEKYGIWIEDFNLDELDLRDFLKD